MTGLADLRQEVANVLDGVGITARRYEGETLRPPCAVVTPGQPYLDASSNRQDVTFTETLLNLDVLLVVGKATAKTSADAVDVLIEKAYGALEDAKWTVTRVTRPGEVSLSDKDERKKTKYLGVVLQLQAPIDRPRETP